MKLQYALSVLFVLSYGFILAQEGIWSVEQLPKVKDKLVKAGLKLDIRQIYREKEDRAVLKPSGIKISLGRSKEVTPLRDSSICLNEAVFDLPGGNGVLVSNTGLAIGVLDYEEVPDSILALLDPAIGVWVSASPHEQKLNEFFAQNVAFTFDLNQDATNDAPITPSVLYKNYSRREIIKRRHEKKYDDEDYLNYISDYYYRPEEKLGVRTLSKTYADVRLIALIEEPLLSKGSDQFIAIFRVYADSLNRPSWAFSPNNLPYNNPHFVPISKNLSSDSFHLVMGYPNESYFYFNSFMLRYAKEESSFNQQFLKELLSGFSPEMAKNFDCECSEEHTLDKAIDYHTFVENLFNNQVATNPTWKQEYGQLLRLMQETYQKQIPYLPAIGYTEAILENQTGLVHKINTLRKWKTISRFNISTESEDALVTQLTQNDAYELDERSWAKLFELYFTKLPLAHVSPYAKQVLAQHKNNYHLLANALLANPLFTDSIKTKGDLKKNFYRTMDKLASEPGVVLLDSISNYFQKHIKGKVDRLDKFAEHYNELFLGALDAVMHYKPLYPDADRSLRVSYGKLYPSTKGKYFTSNAHLLPSHIGSPAINNQGEVLGIVGAFSPDNEYNLFNFDVKKSHNTIIDIHYILNLLAQHPHGKQLLQEIGK